MSCEDETICKANKVVEKYTEIRTRNAFQRVEKERKNLGCGCPHCRSQSVEEVNSWIDWLCAGSENLDKYGSTIRYKIDKKGVITQGDE